MVRFMYEFDTARYWELSSDEMRLSYLHEMVKENTRMGGCSLEFVNCWRQAFEWDFQSQLWASQRVREVWKDFEYLLQVRTIPDGQQVMVAGYEVHEVDDKVTIEWSTRKVEDDDE